VAGSLFDRLVELGLSFDGALIFIFDKEKKNISLWIASNQLSAPVKIDLPYDKAIENNTIIKDLWHAIETGEHIIDRSYSGEVKNEYFRYVAKYNESKIPEPVRHLQIEKESWTAHFVAEKNSMMGFDSWSGHPTKEEDFKILIRFAKVFEQAYTRFLDLQKAEAQAREAQIELGLERVRARAMAMQKSDELNALIAAVYDELTRLNVSLDRCFIMIFDPETLAATWWMGSREGSAIQQGFYVKYHDHLPHLAYLSAWQKRLEKWQYLLQGQEKKEWDEFLFSETELTNLPDFVITNMKNVSTAYISGSFNNFGSLTLGSLEPLPDESFNILVRFAKVFDSTYTRFNDLKQAEAQAREAQIEAALERVRSSSLAMHRSDELQGVINTVIDQLKELHIEFDTSNILIFNSETKSIEFWTGSNSTGVQLTTSWCVPYTDHPLLKELYQALHNNQEVFFKYLAFKEKNRFFNYLFTNTDFKNLNAERKKFIFESKSASILDALVKNIGIQIISYSKEHFLLEEIEILKRFAKVFEQAHTRFLDLQKAEAQTREAQIELALERVRARTMAMHKSEELLEAAILLYSEFRSLGITQYFTCGFVLIDEESNSQHVSITNFDGDVFQSFKLPLTGDPVFQLRYERWKQKDPVFYQKVGGEELKKHLAFAIPHFGSKEAEEMVATQFPDPTFFYMGNFSHGYLHIVGDSKLTAEEEALLARFTRVFEMTYKRFLDLQKAEAQAREAQIQLALERVRARTMAMQRSEELEQCAVLLFQQINELGINAWSAGFSIWQENDTYFIGYNTNPTGGIGAPFRIPLTEDVFFKTIREAKRRGEEFLVFESEGKSLVETYRYMDTLPVVGEVMRGIVSAGYELPKYQVTHCGFFPEGHLMFITLEPHPEAWDIFKRFTKVFEQTYTRFLDLQKAEAQAREAKIETALEKARSRTMGMHSSDELPEVANVLFLEVQALGIPAWSCGYNILAEDKKSAKSWMSSEGTLQTPFKLRLFGEASFAEWGDFLHSEKTMLVQELGDKALDEHYAYMKSFPDLKSTFDQIDKLGLSIPTYQINHLCKFTQGFLLFITYEKVPDAHEIFKRFTRVFEQTYTRFLDLQKAEAQARESQIETALERVRSRTLAIHKSDELAETAAVLFKQLILLGIEPNRLYINIIKNENGESEFWITDEDGSKVSSAFESNMNDNPSFKKMFTGWKEKKKSLVIDMKGKELKEYFLHLGNLHVPFKTGLTQKRRLQYIAYFNKGFIGMASPDEQPEETMNLLERFAAVFNLTFTRFNDLKIAEAHAIQAREDLTKLQTEKRRAEDALNELQFTQKQLIQSEKMASLGELTAGIAHEIQNPLNFVNNFSEVSNELIFEMNVEIEKGDIEEAKAIAKDVQQNLEKILHHGRRADAIVKGMLQHSRSSSGKKESTDINALADEYLRLAYHGLRAKDKSFNAIMKTDFDESIGNIIIIPQEIGRVILNLVTNAFYAVDEKKKIGIDIYEPTVTVSTTKATDKVLISVKDNGNGIPQKILDKIFQPFFTTKPTGQGTGLGLSLSYDIVKAHGGEIKVETNEGEGAAFTLILPISL